MADALPANRRRERAALALRLSGASYVEVAEALEYASAREARHAVESILAETHLDPGTREQLRAEMAARLERMLRTYWKSATDPSDPERFPAGKMSLSVIDRLIKLYGLDAPSEVVVHTPTQKEIDEWVARVTGTTVDELRALEDPNIVDAEIIDDPLPSAG